MWWVGVAWRKVCVLFSHRGSHDEHPRGYMMALMGGVTSCKRFRRSVSLPLGRVRTGFPPFQATVAITGPRFLCRGVARTRWPGCDTTPKTCPASHSPKGSSGGDPFAPPDSNPAVLAGKPEMPHWKIATQPTSLFYKSRHHGLPSPPPYPDMQGASEPSWLSLQRSLRWRGGGLAITAMPAHLRLW